MHSCPNCGQACYCNGDIDDSPVSPDAEDLCVHCTGDEDELDLIDELLDDGPRCRVCGCGELSACPGGCVWAEPDLCSRCARSS